jgi:hypothetical protein
VTPYFSLRIVLPWTNDVVKQGCGVENVKIGPFLLADGLADAKYAHHVQDIVRRVRILVAIFGKPLEVGEVAAWGA